MFEVKLRVPYGSWDRYTSVYLQTLELRFTLNLMFLQVHIPTPDTLSPQSLWNPTAFFAVRLMKQILHYP